MKHIDEIIKKLFEITQDKTRSDINKKECLKGIIDDFASDAVKLALNIKSTSLNREDLEKRVNSFINKTGLLISDSQFN